MRIYFDFYGDFSDVEQEDLCFGAIEFETDGKHYVVDAVGEIDYDFNAKYLGGRFKGDYEQLGSDKPLSNEELEDVILNMNTDTFQYNVLDDGLTLDYKKLDVEIEIGERSLKFTLNK